MARVSIFLRAVDQIRNPAWGLETLGHISYAQGVGPAGRPAGRPASPGCQIATFGREKFTLAMYFSPKKLFWGPNASKPLNSDRSRLELSNGVVESLIR